MTVKPFRNQHNINFVVEAKPPHVTIDCFLLGKGLTADVLFPHDTTDTSENTRSLLQLPHLGETLQSFSFCHVFGHFLVLTLSINNTKICTRQQLTLNNIISSHPILYLTANQ